MFRSSCVKPIVQRFDWEKECTVKTESNRKEEEEDNEISTGDFVHEMIPECYSKDKDVGSNFKGSMISESIGFIDNGTFKIVDDGYIEKGQRIF